MRTPRNPQPFDTIVGVFAIVTALVVIGFAGAPSGAATAPAISVSNALLLLSDEPLLVEGELIATAAGRVRLCAAADPSGCLGTSLCVLGLDPHFAGRVRASGAPLRIVLSGAVGAGVLDLDAGSVEPLRTAGCDLAGERVGRSGAGTDDVPRGGGGVPVLE